MVQVEILIDAIQERPILWDKRIKKYHNRLSSYREWEKLAKELGSTSGIVKKKWKNLRDTFIKEMKKVPKPRSRTDTDNEPKYTGTWPYFDIMSFLTVSVKPRKTVGNISEYVTDTAESNSRHVFETNVADSLGKVLSENEGDSDNTELKESLQEPLQNTFTQPQDSVSFLQNISLRQIPSPSPSPSLPAVRRQIRKRKEGNEFEAFIEIEREKLQLLREDQQDSADDDLLWFRSILPYMKQLPPINKLHFRTQIQEILLKELSKINTPQSSSQHGYYTSM